MEPEYYWVSVLANPTSAQVRGALLVLMAYVGAKSPLRLRATPDYDIDNGHVLVYSALIGWP